MLAFAEPDRLRGAVFLRVTLGHATMPERMPIPASEEDPTSAGPSSAAACARLKEILLLFVGDFFRTVDRSGAPSTRIPTPKAKGRPRRRLLHFNHSVNANPPPCLYVIGQNERQEIAMLDRLRHPPGHATPMSLYAPRFG
jgi:hypothetical protein